MDGLCAQWRVWQSWNSGQNWSLLGTADWAGMGVSDIAFHPDDPMELLAATGDGDFGSAYAIGLMRSLDGAAHGIRQGWLMTSLKHRLSTASTASPVPLITSWWRPLTGCGRAQTAA